MTSRLRTSPLTWYRAPRAMYYDLSFMLTKPGTNPWKLNYEGQMNSEQASKYHQQLHLERSRTDQVMYQRASFS